MRTNDRVALRAWVLAACLGVVPTLARAQDNRPDFKEEGKKLFDKNRQNPGASRPGAQQEGWSIAVFTFRGDERAKESRQVLEFVRTTGRLPEARMEERGESVVILVGDFPDPQAAAAKAELDRVRSITVPTEVNGKVESAKPYALAFLAPPTREAAQGSRPEINLLRVREQNPTAMYSFQVAAYGREDIKDRVPTEDELKEARRSAEQAALQLRSEGEQAFYYHGPRMSLVTIGIFDATDYDPQMPQFESDRLRQVRKRHPLNLYNGKAIKVKADGKQQLQKSQLVDLPKK
jgi:hypothetical protein